MRQRHRRHGSPPERTNRLRRFADCLCLLLRPLSAFQDYAPDTDLDNVRNRVVGILLGLIVTAVVFQYIWPERAIDRLRDALRQALRQLAKLLVIPSPETPATEAKSKADALIAEISRELEQARRQAELTSFEFDEPRAGDRISLGNLETTLSRAEHVLTLQLRLAVIRPGMNGSQLPPGAQAAESELRNAIAKRIERAGVAIRSGIPTLISQPFSPDGPKRCKRSR